MTSGLGVLGWLVVLSRGLLWRGVAFSGILDGCSFWFWMLIWVLGFACLSRFCVGLV